MAHNSDIAANATVFDPAATYNVYNPAVIDQSSDYHNDH